MFPTLRRPLILFVGMLLGVSLTLGYSVWTARAAPSLPWQQANLFAEVYERVRRDYSEEISEHCKSPSHCAA